MNEFGYDAGPIELTEADWMPLTPELIRAAAERAWDEGYASGFCDAGRGESVHRDTRNPHRRAS